METSPRPKIKRRRFATPRAIMALTLREMGTTYGKAFGGYLWTILEPVFGIALLSVVFSLAFRTPPLGTNFPIFFASGFLVFSTYNEIQRRVAMAVIYNKPLLAYPGVTPIDTVLSRFLLGVLTMVVVFYLIITGIELIFDTETSHNYVYMVSGMSMAIALGFGVGCLNCFLFSYFPVWQRIWNILTRPVFLISGVFYLYEDAPRNFQAVLWWNPLVHIVGWTRRGFYSTYEANYVSHIYVYALALFCAVAGIFLLTYHYRRIMEKR